MEIFAVIIGIYALLAALVAFQADRFKRNPYVTFLIGICVTPIGGWLYLRNGKKKGVKHTKRKGPWNEWIVKGERLVEEENWDSAKQAYFKAIELLEQIDSKSGRYSYKYLQSKVSEISYAIDMIDAKKQKGAKVVSLSKTNGDTGIRKASND
jgi:hypothetical protein